MKNSRIALLILLALGTVILHLAPLWIADSFGFDQLRYFSKIFSLFWSLGFGILILLSGLVPRKIFLKKIPAHFFLAGFILIWITILILFRTSAPLLGDGLARIQGVRLARFEELQRQPAFLDAIFHYIFYQLIKNHPRADWLSFVLPSYLAGLLYLLMLYFFSRNFFQSNTEKITGCLVLLTQGYIQLFAGYAENYSFLPALVLFWVWSVSQSEKGKITPLLLSQVLLFLFHLFFLLLLPATLYLLLRQSEKRKRFLGIALGFLGGIFAVIAIYLVWSHFRGLAIFLPLEKIFSLKHLSDFFNYQILSCPALFLLVLSWVWTRKKSPLSFGEKSLWLGSLILVAFFFALRPVIGAMRDWDLFAFPAMLYTPALLIYVLRRLRDEPELLTRLGAMLFLVSAFHTGIWLGLNHSETKMIKRIQYHLEENQGSERWASAYGYIVLGKYYVTTGRIEEALKAFDRSIQIHPSYSQNRLIYGYWLWQKGEHQQALVQLEMAHQINSTNPGIKKFLAHFYLKYAQLKLSTRELSEAEQVLDKLFKLAPDWEPGLKALAEFYQIYLPNSEKARTYKELWQQAIREKTPERNEK